MKLASRKQLINKLAMKGYDMVVRVVDAPEGILNVDICPYAQDIAEVELADNVQLAVVVDAELTPLDKVVGHLAAVETMVSGHLNNG